MKKSKKRWAWTKAQKRKHWSLRDKRKSSSVPKWFCKSLDKTDKNRLRSYIQKIKKGSDPDNVVYNPKYNNKGAKWLWW